MQSSASYVLSITITEPNASTGTLGSGGNIFVDGMIIDQRTNPAPPAQAVINADVVSVYLYYYDIPPALDPLGVGVGRVRCNAGSGSISTAGPTTANYSGTVVAIADTSGEQYTVIEGSTYSNDSIELHAFLVITDTGAVAKVPVLIIPPNPGPPGPGQ